MKFVLFKLQKNERVNKYSFVDTKTLRVIPKDIILGTKNVSEKKELTKELAEKLMGDILNANN